MWLGCLLIVVGMWPSFADHYWPDDPAIAAWCQTLYDRVIYAKIFCGSKELVGEDEKENGRNEGSREWVVGADAVRHLPRVRFVV